MTKWAKQGTYFFWKVWWSDLKIFVVSDLVHLFIYFFFTQGSCPEFGSLAIEEKISSLYSPAEDKGVLEYLSKSTAAYLLNVRRQIVVFTDDKSLLFCVIVY